VAGVLPAPSKGETIAGALLGPGRATRGAPRVYGDLLGGIREGVAAGQTRFGKAVGAVKGYLRGMERVGNTVEVDNRLAAYTALLSEGWDFAAAADKVKAMHVDYSKAASAPFETEFMKRLVPFYQFQRRMVPELIREYLERPGGRLGMLTRASNRLRGEGLLPEHIAGGLAIPVGEETAAGEQRFLTGLDLPHEVLGDLFKPSATFGGTVENTLRSLLGQVHPVLKAPLEVATGKQFFSGRDLRDLRGNIGQTIENLTGQKIGVSPLLEQGLAMSPLSRLGTTVRTLSDPRKWTSFGLPQLVNLGTGARLADVNLPQQQGIVARELIDELLTGSPGVGSFRKVFVNPENIENLTPEELDVYRLYRFIEAEAQRKGRARRKAAGR
jgi:hypothetical protein